MVEVKKEGPKATSKRQQQVAKDEMQKLLKMFGRGLRGRELDKTPVTRTELNTQLSVMSAIIAELYLAVVSQGKDLRKRVTYRIRLGGEIDLFITCDEKKYKEMMRQLRKETTKLLRDLAPFNAALGGEAFEGAVPDDDDEPVPPFDPKRGYA